jgi:protein transport protein SEC20
MLAELERSRFAQETLERGTAQLKQLDEQYTNLDTILASSRSLLRTLVTSQKSDTWYLETAFWILVCTCGWLFFRRILYGPLWLFILWPLKLGFRLLLLILSAIGLTGASSQVASSSSLNGIQASLGSIPSIYATMPSNQAKGDVNKRRDGGDKQPDPSLDGSLTQQIGQMIEKTRETDKDGGDRKEEDQIDGKEPVTRGDGTVLRERGDIPPNPKKRVFDVNLERNLERDEL